MRTTTLRISRACNNACPFCDVHGDLDQKAIAPAALRSALDAAVGRGVQRVIFSGGEPSLSGQLVAAISYARALGLRTALATNGRLLCDPARVGRVEAAGLDELWLTLHSVDPEVHNALVGGDPLAYGQTRRALEIAPRAWQRTVRAIVTTRNLDAVPGLLALCAAEGATLELRRLTPAEQATEIARVAPELDPGDDAALEVLDLATRAAATLGVSLRARGFARAPTRAAPGPLSRADGHDAATLADDRLSPRMSAGLLAPDADTLRGLCAAAHATVDAVALGWAVRGAPWRDVAPALGGDGQTALPADLPPELSDRLTRPRRPAGWEAARGRIEVIAAPPGDAWSSASVLPGLVHRLRERGANVRWHSPYDHTFDPARVEPPDRRGLPAIGASLRALVRGPTAPLPHPLRVDPADPAARAAYDAFVNGLDLAGADCVIAPDLEIAGRLRARLPPTVRVECHDDAMLEGMLEVPGERDVIRTPFMYHFNLFGWVGVAPATLLARPSPVFRGHVPTGIPAERCAAPCALIVDPVDAALAVPEAARRLSPPASPTPSALAELASARFVILPWAEAKPQRHLRWIGLAQAAGRPLLAPDLPVIRDHIRHGVDGLLVPPGDRAAWSAALRALADDATLARLARGAAAAAEAADVDRWARELIEGAPATRVIGAADGRGPWRLW